MPRGYPGRKQVGKAHVQPIPPAERPLPPELQLLQTPRPAVPPPYQREYAETVARAAARGATNAELQQLLGVDAQVILLWSMVYDDFANAMAQNEAARIARVQDAMYQRAIGYEQPSEKVIVVEGKVIHEPIIEHIPADPGAGYKYLEARDPGNWRQRREVSISGRVAAIHVNMTPEEARKAFLATMTGGVVEGEVEDDD